MFRNNDWIPSEWALTPTESEIFTFLTARSPSTKKHIWTLLYGNDPNGGKDPKAIDVFISSMRQKLKPHKIVIETMWGKGYCLRADALKKARALKAEYAKAQSEAEA
jgi:DNA-binding response OmpR family regulator